MSRILSIELKQLLDEVEHDLWIFLKKINHQSNCPFFHEDRKFTRLKLLSADCNFFYVSFFNIWLWIFLKKINHQSNCPFFHEDRKFTRLKLLSADCNFFYISFFNIWLRSNWIRLIFCHFQMGICNNITPVYIMVSSYFLLNG